MHKSECNARTCIALLLLICNSLITSTSGWFYTKEDRAGDAEIKSEVSKNRQFPECNCLQKLRTNYFFENTCGKAALCYWEMWNYNKEKARIQGVANANEECDSFLTQGYACLIGYPSPREKKEICDRAVIRCNKDLAKILYDDCEDIRKKRGLPKPQDIKTTLTLDDMNLDLKEDEQHIFEPKPSSEKPVTNHYYALSCPVVFRFPYFTIALLFKEWDPSIVYDETTGLKAVAHMLPKYLREGINNERIQNFDALSLDANLINWCNIPRNYICITEEKDPDSKTLCNCNLCPLQKTCDPSYTPSPSGDDECDFHEMIENNDLTTKGMTCPEVDATTV